MQVLVVALIYLALLAAGGPGSDKVPAAPQKATATLNQEFRLPMKTEVGLPEEKLTIALREVVEDSRCPEGVNCFWEGNAKVRVMVRKTGQAPATIDLNTSGRIGPNKVTYREYEVELVSVSPTPKQNQTIPQKDYVASMRITRK